jgi:hypothetical protein
MDWTPEMKAAAMVDAQKVCDLTAEVERLSQENEGLRTENIQLKFACGYPMPADLEHLIIPENPFRCGVCDARNIEAAAAPVPVQTEK